jgi:predicted phosphohydrolase
MSLKGTSNNSFSAAPGCEIAYALLPLVNIAHWAMLSSGRFASATSRAGSLEKRILRGALKFNPNYFICIFALASIFYVDSFALPGKIYFMSDMQLPMIAEKIFLKSYKNREARDSLFSDIIRQNPKNVFMLGDLVSRGTSENAWLGIDTLLHSLKAMKSSVYTTPGNHEYYWTAKKGIKNFLLRFPEKYLRGYCVVIDSIAVIMLNSNFSEMTKDEIVRQRQWYASTMDSLDIASGIKIIIVGTHYSPFSNSKVVGSASDVFESVVPGFEKSNKARLFISGHSHNLEFFKDSLEKYFVVIGGGGGIMQPLVSGNRRHYRDLIDKDDKPLYFYFIVERNGDMVSLTARGFKKDFKMFELKVGEIRLKP